MWLRVERVQDKARMGVSQECARGGWAAGRLNSAVAFFSFFTKVGPAEQLPVGGGSGLGAGGGRGEAAEHEGSGLGLSQAGNCPASAYIARALYGLSAAWEGHYHVSSRKKKIFVSNH